MAIDKPLDGSDATDPEIRRQVVAARQFVASLNDLRDALKEIEPFAAKIRNRGDRAI